MGARERMDKLLPAWMDPECQRSYDWFVRKASKREIATPLREKGREEIPLKSK